uniref:Large ribosomal subunit protein mL46 n=1 Tax=Brassica campestris TaxID=3711 RepID=A0A3P6CD58_BRACM|nr:unnamed protein product [Brassica rapa]
MLRYSCCISNRSYEAKQPSFYREQRRVSSDRITLCSGGGGATAVVSSSRLRDLVFVVNPQGANGRTAKEWKKLLPYLRSRLGEDCNICESLTSGPSHAIDITREAIRDGADAVIAVGGDGTLHEVVNGFFWEGKPVGNLNSETSHSAALGVSCLNRLFFLLCILRFIRKNDPCEAVDRIAKGIRSRVDVGVIDQEGRDSHYFINVADVHLSAKAGFYASKYKKFGSLCYVIGALQAFMGHDNRDMRIKVNGGEWEIYPQVTALCVGNANYFGGGMKITPNASPGNGNLEVVVLQDFKWYDFILKLHRLYNGTHLSVNNVSSRSVQSIEVEEVSESGSIYVQSDGEHLGFLPRKFQLVRILGSHPRDPGSSTGNGAFFFVFYYSKPDSGSANQELKNPYSLEFLSLFRSYRLPFSKLRSQLLVRPLLESRLRGYCTSSSSEKIVASVLFERLRVVIPKPDPTVYAFQEFKFNWQQQFRRRYPDEFLDIAKNRAKGEYQMDYVPAPRITEADKTNDRKSLYRALDKKLYLLVFGKPFGATSDKPVWHFPEKVYDSEPTLRKCAESALKSVLGDLTHTYFVGNAPMAHMAIQPTEETPDLPSYKRFFFKCSVVAASKYNISNCEDFVWVTKDELLEFFPEQADFFNKMIIS